MSGQRDTFASRAERALRHAPLQQALANVPVGFVAKRRKAMQRLAEFPALCRQVAAMRRAALADNAALLARFRERAEAAGAQVHLAADAAQARAIIRDILQRRGARLVVKGKSMTAEEIRLNPALEEAGIAVVETDLGEYIIQLRHEPPSHIVAPAIHLRIDDIAEDFRRAHADLPAQRPLLTAQALAAEARAVLRRKFLAADAGITGANALLAETGQIMLITNEGNGDLCATNPHLHIVIAGVEKLVPDMAAALDVVRVLPRSATGQDITVYANFHGGVRRKQEPDGAREMHIVLLTAARQQMLQGPFGDMLACIRCGACLNHCPVYQSTGGHAYGNVYSGPMGIVLGRAVFGLRGDGLLAEGVEDACTLCNRCAEVCPAGIDLPGLIRRWRAEAVRQGREGRMARLAQRLHAALAARPRLYARAAAAGARLLRWLRGHPRLARRLPGLRAWMRDRALPDAPGKTFLGMAAGKAWEAEAANTCHLPAPDEPAAATPDTPARRIIPARAQVAGEAAVRQFAEQAEAAAATVHHLASIEEVPAIVRQVLQQADLPPESFIAPSLLADHCAQGGVQPLPAFSPDQLPAAILPAFAAAAETGTLVFASNAEWPIRATLLPDILFAVLRMGDIRGGYEQAIAHALRLPGIEALGSTPADALPRSLMLITGPSRTADVEQTLVIGAHGPKAVHILLLNDAR